MKHKLPKDAFLRVLILFTFVNLFSIGRGVCLPLHHLQPVHVQLVAHYPLTALISTTMWEKHTYRISAPCPYTNDLETQTCRTIPCRYLQMSQTICLAVISQTILENILEYLSQPDYSNVRSSNILFR